MTESICKYFTGILIPNSTHYGCSIRIECAVNGFGGGGACNEYNATGKISIKTKPNTVTCFC